MRHLAPAAAIMRCVTFDPFRTLAIPDTRTAPVVDAAMPQSHGAARLQGAGAPA
jgi:hypothetical protein